MSQEPFRPEYEAYALCVHEYVQRRNHEIASLELLRQMALPQCRTARARLLARIIENRPERSISERRRFAEAAVSTLEEGLPGVFSDVLELVPGSVCPSGLALKQECLDWNDPTASGAGGSKRESRKDLREGGAEMRPGRTSGYRVAVPHSAKGTKRVGSPPFVQ